MNFTNEWFVPRIPQWEIDLAPLKGKPNLECLEIGSYEGRSAVWLMQNVLTHPSSVLHCVDLWVGDSGLRGRFIENMNTLGRAGNWDFRTCPSSMYLVDQNYERGPQYLDFVYIDGSHTAPDVLQDAVLAWPLLKIGGIMTFDDYLWEGGKVGQPEDSPQLAIAAFLACMKGRFDLLHMGVQVTVRRIR